MGPKSSTASQSNEYTTLLKDYDIVKQVDAEGLFFLKNNRTAADFLLRELTFNDKKEFERWVEIFQKRKLQLQNCKYVVPLQKIITKAEDQYCSTFYKIYALFQFTERTLEDEINERSLQKRKFQEKELWSILASCIVGMSHMQKQNIKHQALRSNTVLISSQGIIKVYDLIATGAQNNYDTLISKRSTPHIYLSPELAYCLQIEAGVPPNNSYKSDIWSMGMIILEAGLLKYQDECYRDECSRVHWETVQYNIHLFSQSYSQELTALVEFMLSRDQQNRPDWLELQERVIKEEQTRMSQVNISKESNVSRMSQRAYQAVSYNPPLRNNIKDQPPFPVNTQTVPIFQESARVNPKSFGAPLASQSYGRPPLAESSTPKASANQALVQFKPSIIETSRPLRNIFPANTYITQTKVDQNLIVVPEDERYSDVEQTPHNKYSSSYFESNPKNVMVQSAQAPRFYNTFTPTQQQHTFTQQAIRQPQVNTYGVSVFHPPNPILNSQAQAFQHISLSNQQPPASSYQTPVIHQTPIINQNQQPVFTPPPQVQPNSGVPKGEEGEYVIERYRQGSEYKGYKWEGMRHGFGVFYYQDGGMYEGEWRFNKMQGKGKLYYQSGKLAYEGDWANDQFQGMGKLYNEYPEVTNQPLNYKNLDEIDEMWTKYEGEFRGDLKNGHGILFMTNGEYYQGEFFDDYAHGQGVYVTMTGNRVGGRWDRNLFLE